MNDLFPIALLSILVVFFIVLLRSGSSPKENPEYTRGLTEGMKVYQIEAVKEGVGEWIVDETGETEFKWKRNIE
jgi:hypothetical protein